MSSLWLLSHRLLPVKHLAPAMTAGFKQKRKDRGKIFDLPIVKWDYAPETTNAVGSDHLSSGYNSTRLGSLGIAVENKQLFPAAVTRTAAIVF